MVVGAGSGGYVAGIRAAQLGMTVAIIEERYWGGVCLNTGCVPSKALLRNAEIASILTHQADEFGICGDIKLDYARAVSRSREVADARVRGVHFLMRKNKITEIDGRGRFSGSHTLDVQLRDGGTTSLRFDNAIIATGSRVRMLPGVTLSDNIVTYEQQILDADIPESIVIIGAGGIGMEFAYILQQLRRRRRNSRVRRPRTPQRRRRRLQGIDPPVPTPRHPHPHQHPGGLGDRPRRPHHRHPH